MEPREIIRYTPEDIVKQSECPACGIDMSSLKKPFSHAKKCFSIRRPGPVYRIFGYEECQCGLLIHDGSKAQKLHICMASPSPDQVPLPASDPAPAALPPPAPKNRPDKILQPQKKVWVRNFTSPIKQKFEDIKLSGICKPKPKSVPRVRNFDTPSRAASDEVCVYSIIRKDESISIAGGLVIKEKQETKENVIIKKRSLRLPALRKS
ncbi:hypothetical protein KR059_011662 [Drosophila kikkawai]|nr:hypothetical protein KR059_011662 [Drosophila kikkawai]